MDAADPPVDAAMWLDRLRTVIERAPDEAVRQLEEITAMAANDPDHEVAVLRALAALAWRTPRAGLLFSRLESVPASGSAVRWRERVRLDLIAASAYRAAYRPILPPFVHDFITDTAIDSRDRRCATARALVGELAGDPVHYLESFDTLDSRCHDLFEALTLRLLDDVAVDRQDLDGMSPRLAAELSQRLSRLGGGLAAFLVTALGVGAVAAGAGVAVWLDPSLGMMAAGGGVFGAGGIREQAYRRRIRCELVRIVADLGVTRACVRESMRRKGGRLDRFATPAGRDRSLRLCGMVAAAAHSVAEAGDLSVDGTPDSRGR